MSNDGMTAATKFRGSEKKTGGKSELKMALAAKAPLITAMDTYAFFNQFRNNRILVVDDEEFCISAMRAVLFSTGIDVDYQVEYCITGKEAIEQLQITSNYGMSYSLILTDFNMPIMNGIEATIKMRKYLKDELGLSPED